MLSPLRNRFGIPGVIAVIALVFAMLGGAYAANNDGSGATASAKKNKKAKKGPRGPRGKTGPAGPAGPQGPAGANGQDGLAGLNGLNGEDGKDGKNGTSGTSGTDGVDGKSILSGSGAPDNSVGVDGDFYMDTAASEMYGPKESGAWGSGTPLVGPQGDPGPEGVCSSANCVLPTGVTLKGTWSFGPIQAAAANEAGIFSISWGIPVSSDPVSIGTKYMKEGETENSSAAKVCKGGPAAPVVEPTTSGQTIVCIWATKEVNWTPSGFGDIPTLKAQEKKGGAIIEGKAPAVGAAYAYGTWAVMTKP